MKNKKTISLILAIFLLILLAPYSKANYQISPNGTRVREYQTNMAVRVRYMEASNQVMGLNELCNGTTLEATTESNNIDVHMLKNTEYGAVAILSASKQYGKQGTGADSYINKNTSTGIATTTGNQYGVYEMGQSHEWVAGGRTNTTPYLNKYYDIYTTNASSAKVGDATIETKTWKGSKTHHWLTGYSSGQAFLRGSDGVFSYDSSNVNWAINGRAAVWCRRRILILA